MAPSLRAAPPAAGALTLDYTSMAHWPPLAWLATCVPGRAVIHVFHGPQVETRAEWFCEATWGDAFEAGGFDRTDVVFGSGARVRGDEAIFVSSASTVDRLQTLETQGGQWVSNSLACLLAATGAVLDPTYRRYFEDFKTITWGLQRYRRTVGTTAGAVRLVYYHNLRWCGGRLGEAPKPNPHRDFGSFESYRGFLRASLRALSDNVTAATRRHPHRLLGTISRGYDSATVVTLAREFGLGEVISFAHAQGGASDSGAEIAARLGVEAVVVPRDAWRAVALAEVPFIAADAKGEDVFYRGAEPTLAGRALLTGHYGGKVWDMHATALSPDIVRGDQDGLSLSEYRLWAGFVHCPIPFLGARQSSDINTISRSREMRPWDTGGRYSRPICRRIVEDAGVPRKSFGIRKQYSSVLFFERGSFLAPASLGDYLDWLDRHAATWMERGRLPPHLRGDVRSPARHVAGAAGTMLRALARHTPRLLAPLVAAASDRLAALGDREPLFPHLFPWAMERATARYGGPLGPAGVRIRTPTSGGVPSAPSPTPR